MDTDLEIRDVLPFAEGAIYSLLEEESVLTRSKLESLLVNGQISERDTGKVIELLLWHGVLGIWMNADEAVFIHSVAYDMKKLNAVARKVHTKDPRYLINPAFWPGLETQYVRR